MSKKKPMCERCNEQEELEALAFKRGQEWALAMKQEGQDIDVFMGASSPDVWAAYEDLWLVEDKQHNGRFFDAFENGARVVYFGWPGGK